VRDALAWSKYINEALYEFGQDAQVMFASHTWPRFGNARIQEVMRGQRDLYANMNNQILHLANNGVTVNQIQNVYSPPKSLQQQWYARSYHGSVEHNSRAVINRYLGYWDANPTTLIPLSPEDSAPLYVEMMGGAEKILARGQELYDQGKYRHAQEILNKLVYAEPDNQAAKDLLADCFEQFGYQQESSSVRNSFLAAALELRSGIPAGIAPKSLTPDVIQAMSMSLFLDYLGILVDSPKADGFNFKINIVLPDSNEAHLLEMSNATLTNIEGRTAKDADLTLTIGKIPLMQVMMGSAKLADLIESGAVKTEGDLGVLGQLKASMGRFDPLFEIMPGTKKN
jgi:alkyl sulfatase BDS1-like metallo-beta-lactamase superfamily hydrolase